MVETCRATPFNRHDLWRVPVQLSRGACYAFYKLIQQLKIRRPHRYIMVTQQSKKFVKFQASAIYEIPCLNYCNTHWVATLLVTKNSRNFPGLFRNLNPFFPRTLFEYSTYQYKTYWTSKIGIKCMESRWNRNNVRRWMKHWGDMPLQLLQVSSEDAGAFVSSNVDIQTAQQFRDRWIPVSSTTRISLPRPEYLTTRTFKDLFKFLWLSRKHGNPIHPKI